MGESSPISGKKLMKSYEDDANEIIFSLTVAQRNSLLLRYAELDSERQNDLDNTLKKFVKLDHQLLIKFKSEVDKESLGKIGKLMSAKGVDKQLAVTSMNLEHMKFWYENSTRGEMPPEERLNPEQQNHLKKLASYVPKLVMRRLYNSPDKIKATEVEMYEACVVFADISGFTPLTEKMAALGPEGVEKLTTELNKYFDLLIGSIYRHGGDIVKFAGDALLVIWPAASKEGIQNNQVR